MPTRAFVVDRRLAGRSLLDALQASLHLSKADALQSIRRRQVRLAGRVCAEPRRQVKAGQRVEVQVPEKRTPTAPRKEPRQPATSLPPIARGIKVRHVDDQIIVVEKPPGLTTVRHADEAAEFGSRARKFLPPTLVDLLPAVLAARGIKGEGRIRAVHRLDKETSGLLVLARTPAAERHLGQQFRAHTVGRTYLALVRGTATDARIESNLVRDRGDGRRGSGPPEQGQHAVTHVRVVEGIGDYTLVECRLETGRTHQVRIHLGEAGTPLCGERVYDRPPHGHPLPDGSGAKRPMLHAASLAFDHPATGERLDFAAPMPDDMKRLRLSHRREKGRP